MDDMVGTTTHLSYAIVNSRIHVWQLHIQLGDTDELDLAASRQCNINDYNQHEEIFAS
jgi:hypothetical protein